MNNLNENNYYNSNNYGKDNNNKFLGKKVKSSNFRTDKNNNKVESCYLDTIGTSNFELKLYTTTNVAPGPAAVITNTTTIDGRKVDENGLTEDAKSDGCGLVHSDAKPDNPEESYEVSYSKQCFILQKEDNDLFFETLKEWGIEDNSIIKGTVFDVERRN